jgi:hypothetical protein
MKLQTILTSCILIVLIASVAPVAADGTSGVSSSGSGSSYIYVSSVTMNPEVFYPYEQGTVTVTLTNDGNTSIGVTHPNILSASDAITIVNEDKWKTVSYIASGNSISYTFVVTVNGFDGRYFGLFTVETMDSQGAYSQNVHYPLIMEVNSKDLTPAISKKPETFTLDSDASVNLSLINPRDGAINDIVITTEGTGMDITPTQTFVSSLTADSATEIPFTINPHRATNVTFNISYKNGDTDRHVSVVLPVNLGTDKEAAVPTVNNLALSSKGSYYDLTGDISNSGITDAKGLVVAVGSPAAGIETYPEYAIGSLASDDSSSFELTFSCADLSAVPLVMHWKDSAGTDYSCTKILDLTSSASAGAASPSAGSTGKATSKISGFAGTQGGPGGMGVPGGDMNGPPGSSTTSSGSILSTITSAKGNGISSFYPVIGMVVLLIAGAVAYKKRKWIIAKLKKQ